MPKLEPSGRSALHVLDPEFELQYLKKSIWPLI